MLVIRWMWLLRVQKFCTHNEWWCWQYFWLLNVLLMVEYTSEKLFYTVPLEDSLHLVLFCRCFSISCSSQSLKMIWVKEVKFSPSFQPFFFSRCCLFLHLCSPLAFPSCFLSLSVLQWVVVCVCLSEALFLNLVSCLHMQISKSSY